jgi:predicted regulator of Ras-like GTPase activity (Roadblock/LC7/MglB family)
MPTIRDVVQALSRREGVDAVVVLGRDGLTIDSASRNGLDPDGLAALVPSVAAACSRLGSAASRGDFNSGVVEFGRGMIVVSVLSPDVLLAIVVAAGVNIGALLFELQQHRVSIAGLL